MRTITPAIRAFASFFTGAVAAAILGSVFVVFVLQGYDAKFRDAPFVALQVELLGMAVAVIVAAVVLGVVLLLRVRGEHGAFLNTRHSGIAGMVFSIGVFLLGPLLQGRDPESLLNPLIGWAYLLTYPLIIGLLLTKRVRALTPN